jgi:hypothetical protein
MATYRFDLNYAIALVLVFSQPGSSDRDKQLADRIDECAKNYRLRDGKPKVDVDLTGREAVTVRALLPKLTKLAESISDELRASGCTWRADGAATVNGNRN